MNTNEKNEVGLACPKGGCEDVQAMETPVVEHDGKCCKCKIIELYKQNKSGLCPDCAADKRGEERKCQK